MHIQDNTLYITKVEAYNIASNVYDIVCIQTFEEIVKSIGLKIFYTY